MGELDIRPADDLDCFHDTVRVLLQARLQLRSNREHRGGAVRVARVNSHRVHVLDETHGDHLVLSVSNDFELQLFPAENRFFHQDLPDETCRKASTHNRLELFGVVDDPSAGPTHGVGGADDERETQTLGNFLRFAQTACDFAFRNLKSQPLHRIFERLAILTTLDRIHVDPDHPNALLFQDSRLRKLRGQVQPGLAPEVRQQRIGPLQPNNFGQAFQRQGLDIGDIGHPRVGHDRGGIGVDEQDFVTELSKGLACLGPRIVKLTGLPDHDRTGTDYQYFVYVLASGHWSRPLEIGVEQSADKTTDFRCGRQQRLLINRKWWERHQGAGTVCSAVSTWAPLPSGTRSDWEAGPACVEGGSEQGAIPGATPLSVPPFHRHLAYHVRGHRLPPARKS